MTKAQNIVRGSYHNIVKAYKEASIDSYMEGLLWYRDAHRIAEQVSTLLGTEDVRVGAGIISALSPQMDWGENIVEALKFASLGYSIRQTSANNAKAQRISEGEDPETVLGGAKVMAFYHAILEPDGNGLPVVDSHAQAIYCGKPVSKRDKKRAFSNPKVMKRIQTSYKLASKKLGIHYNVVQAVTWIQHRKNKGYVKVTPWEK